MTIRDVAREAGVSVASVSRVLNGLNNVKPETRQTILEAVERLRYMPHLGARSLSTRRSNVIGVLLPDLYGEFFSELIRGIDSAARDAHMQLLVSSAHGDAEEAASAVGAMQGRVDGLLVMSPHVDGPFLDRCLPRGLPIVLLNSSLKRSPHPTLMIDNYGGSRKIVRHLIDLGHRRIAHISGPADNFDAQERLRGYRDEIAATKSRMIRTVVAGDFSEESGYRAGRELCERSTLPDAIFAANDMMAIGCLAALTEAGLGVPDDIALAGFDDIPMARFVSPALTTIRVRIADFGRNALQRLVGRLEGTNRAPGPSEVFEPELVVRRSCGSTAPVKRGQRVRRKK